MSDVEEEKPNSAKQKDLLKIRRDTDLISNSSSVFENEKLKRKAEKEKNTGKIELEFEVNTSHKMQD